MKIEMLFGSPLMAVGSDILLYMLSAQVDFGIPKAGRLSDAGIEPSIAESLEDLKQDLLRLQRGWRPSSSDLADAPELTKWGILDTGDPLPKIVGDVVELGGNGLAAANGKRVVTHHVLARDSALTWIRDRTRFYRLDRAPPDAMPRVVPPRRRRPSASLESSRSGRMRF